MHCTCFHLSSSLASKSKPNGYQVSVYLVASLIPAQCQSLRRSPGWSHYYLDYKFLKKIVSSLSKSRPASEAAALAIGIRPGDFSSSASSHQRRAQPPLWPSSEIATPGSLTAEHTSLLPLPATSNDDERGSAFQAHKAAFFFKLERELEKVPMVSPDPKSNIYSSDSRAY